MSVKVDKIVEALEAAERGLSGGKLISCANPNNATMCAVGALLKHSDPGKWTTERLKELNDASPALSPIVGGLSTPQKKLIEDAQRDLERVYGLEESNYRQIMTKNDGGSAQNRATKKRRDVVVDFVKRTFS